MNPESAQCVQAVTDILCRHTKELLQKLLRRDNIDIQVCKLLGAFPDEPDIEHLEKIQRCISFNCCL